MTVIRGWMFGLMLLSLSGCGGCVKKDVPWPEVSGPKAVASFPPIYCFAENVAGDDAAIRNVMAGQGPHHFDPKPSEFKIVRGADLFFINGLGLDNRIAELIVTGSGNKEITIVDTTRNFNEKELLEPMAGDDHGHSHGSHDPHVWLGIDSAIEQVQAIAEGFAKADPSRAENYQRRATEYTERLAKIQTDGKAMLADIKNRRMVTFHESLGYFARSFDLEIVAVIESTPGQEPTSKSMEALVETCLEKNVEVIAVEPQYSRGTSAKRILDELRKKGVNARFVEIDPLETTPLETIPKDWYETKMRENLAALKKAMQ